MLLCQNDTVKYYLSNSPGGWKFSKYYSYPSKNTVGTRSDAIMLNTKQLVLSLFTRPPYASHVDRLSEHKQGKVLHW